jgi:hypothetical protein
MQMVTQEDLQPESVFMRAFTLRQNVRMVADSYGSVLLKMAILMFACLLFRAMALGTMMGAVQSVIAFVEYLLVSLVLLVLLSFLTQVYGTARTLLFWVGMAMLMALVVLVSAV